jgi:hypothetical protein
MLNQILEYLILLSTLLILPVSIWIIASSRIFSRLLEFTPDTYQERVRAIVEDAIVERICQLLNDLFPRYGLTPSRNAPFSTIVQNLLNEAGAPDRLAYLANMYESLVEQETQGPFFHQIVQAYLTIMGGGGC